MSPNVAYWGFGRVPFGGPEVAEVGFGIGMITIRIEFPGLQVRCWQGQECSQSGQLEPGEETILRPKNGSSWGTQFAGLEVPSRPYHVNIGDPLFGSQELFPTW